MEDSNNKPPTGLPADSSGGPTVDPTRNVLDLVQAAVNRLDDLRAAETKRVDEKIKLEKSHVRELMKLRETHAENLREAEAKRIDAIRLVDVNALTSANERAASQASIVATQVSNTAATVAAQIDQLTRMLSDRIAAVEKSQYEGVGKGSGLNAGWGYLLGAAGLIGTILAIIFAFAR